MPTLDSVYARLQALPDKRSSTIFAQIFQSIWKSDPTTKLINSTAATLAITFAKHAGKIITLNKADGQAISLPAAIGSGEELSFFIGTTITSVGTTFTKSGTDTLVGGALFMSDNAADAVTHFKAGTTDSVITLNGTTKGGYKGDSIVLTDVALGLWLVKIVAKATGVEATPFS